MGNGCGGDGKALRVARGIDINILYIQHTTYMRMGVAWALLYRDRAVLYDTYVES
jgi:hypothetical protein